LIALISAIIITGDRVVVLFIFGIIFFNLIFNFYVRKYFFGIFIIFGLVAIILVNSIDKLSDRYVNKFDPIKKIITNYSFEETINSPWISHYLVSWEMIKEKPFFGFGHKGFRIYCNQYVHKETISKYKHKCTTHPHNTYFEILVETGLLGLVTFVFFNIIIFIKVLKRKDENIFYIYSIIFAILNPLRTSGSFFTTWNGGIFWMILGVLLYFLFNNEKYEKKYSDFN